MRHTLTLPHTRTVSRSLSLSVVRALHRCLRGLEHVCLACAVLLARSRFREILSNLRASGSRYQYAGDSRNFRETWDVCMFWVYLRWRTRRLLCWGKLISDFGVYLWFVCCIDTSPLTPEMVVGQPTPEVVRSFVPDKSRWSKPLSLSQHEQVSIYTPGEGLLMTTLMWSCTCI